MPAESKRVEVSLTTSAHLFHMYSVEANRGQRTAEVSEAITRLLESGFLKEQVSAADDPIKYHVDPVTMSALPV